MVAGIPLPIRPWKTQGKYQGDHGDDDIETHADMGPICRVGHVLAPVFGPRTISVS
jgi:hypothetical protein